MAETAVTRALPELERLAAVYDEKQLRPVIDPLMEMVLIDCPRCKAQENDPEGMWRPVRVVPRTKTRIILCTACGARDEQ